MEWNGYKDHQSTKWQVTQKCGSNEASISNLTSWSLEPGVWNIGISSNHSYRREPEPVAITDVVTNTQTPEKGRPSSDNKMNHSQNKYIWIKTNEAGPHEVTWGVNFGEHWPHQQSLGSTRRWINKSIDVIHFRTYKKMTSGMIRQSNGKYNECRSYIRPKPCPSIFNNFRKGNQEPN